MKSRALLFGLLVLLFLVNQSFAESRAKGSATVNGKTINFEFVGERSVSASSSTSNDRTTINVTLDGTTHQITVTPKKLKWNDRTFKLGDYKTIDIYFKGGKSSVKVDGKEIQPIKKK